MALLRRSSIAILAGAICAPAGLAAASAVLVVPGGSPQIQTGIGGSLWTGVTADLQAATGGYIVQSTTAVDDATTLNSDNGVWVDLGPTGGALTQNEALNLQAYIETGRRAVLIGESTDWATWDTSILNVVGGSYAGEQFNGVTSTHSFVALTAGVTSLNAVNAGVASAGTSLFQDRVATVWGNAQNALVLLDTTGLSDAYLSSASNTTFASNLTNWISGGFGVTTSWKPSLGGVWTTSTAWSASQMPSVADTVVFNLGRNSSIDTGYTVALPTAKAVAGMNVLSDKVTLTLPAGPALSVTGAINIAPPANQASALSLTRSAGSIPAVVSAGSITLGGGTSSTATLNITAGVTLKTSSAVVGSGATLAQSGGSLQIDGTLAGAGSLVQTAGATSASSLRLNAVVLNGGSVTIVPESPHDAEDSVSILSSLSIDNSAARFDLTNNDLIIQNGDLATLTAALSSGYDGGKWDGPGIDSTSAGDDSLHRTALGILQNSDGNGHRLYGAGAPLGLFDGQDPGYDAILIKYTYYGDDDLSGVVDAADVARDRLGKGGWSTGDFNYDGTVDASDLSTQALAISGGWPSLGDSTSVPEPLLVPLMVSSGLLVRRVRRLRD